MHASYLTINIDERRPPISGNSQSLQKPWSATVEDKTIRCDEMAPWRGPCRPNERYNLARTEIFRTWQRYGILTK
jgi:hypothetical protein